MSLKFDMRSAPGIGSSHSELYAAMLDMVEWADRLDGVSTIVNLSEHHSTADGFLPSPIVVAAACLARTRRTRARVTVLLPLYHPIRLAEDLAVLDLLGQGRIDILFIEGYRYEEYEMMEVDITERGRRMTEFTEVIKKAWTGEPFEWRGHNAWVTPRPFQRPRPKISMGGSAAPSARRAARIAEGYEPTVPAMIDVYRQELMSLGKDPGAIPKPARPGVNTKELLVAVSNDPEATWRDVAPFCLEYMNSYAEWIRKGSGAVVARYQEVSNVNELREAGLLRVLSPEECVEWVREREGTFMIVPLLSGLPVAIGWESLRLLADHVFPAA